MRTLFTQLLDFIYPPCCVHCNRVGDLLCNHCQNRIKPAPIQLKGELPHIAGYTTIGVHHSALRSAIHALKYGGVGRLGEILGGLLSVNIIQHAWKVEVVVPVPLHAERLKERGYNQAQLIAQEIANQLVIPLEANALIKTRNTQSQVTLLASERLQNVEGAFEVSPDIKGKLSQKSVLLIDDVFTTGATLSSCAHVLLEAGVKSLYIATASRANFSGTSGMADDAVV
jgi:ComF family protein